MANQLLRGCHCMGPVSIEGMLYDIDGRYPALVLSGGTLVHGEQWSGDDDLLTQLDDYEGVGQGLFRRTTVQVDGHPCWVYVAGPLLEPRLTYARIVLSGDWNAKEEGAQLRIGRDGVYRAPIPE